MLKAISPRLRKPLLYALIGAVFAAAWLVHGGRTWWISILVLVATAVRAGTVYVRAGRDTDEGALAGLGYLFGLSSYGVGEQDPAGEDAGAGHDTPSAFSW